MGSILTRASQEDIERLLSAFFEVRKFIIFSMLARRTAAKAYLLLAETVKARKTFMFDFSPRNNQYSRNPHKRT